MGNSSSNRRVTVVNDDVVGVVQISDNVVRRLRGISEKTPEKEIEKKVEDLKPQPPIESGRPTGGFFPFASSEPYSSTLEQRQKYHEEFKKAEKSWNNRIYELESQNRILFETAKEKFGEVLIDVETNHMKNSYEPVCPEKQQRVLRCYKENVKYPLNCSAEVHDFMECVDKVRMTALSK